MTVVYGICFALLAVSALLTLGRLERGRSILDRMLALDVMTSLVLGSVIIIAAATGRDDVVPVLIVLALVGFVGSVSIARFAAADSADEARILTSEELRAEYEQREALEADDAPPVHDVDEIVIAVLDVPGAYRSNVRRGHSVLPEGEEER